MEVLRHHRHDIKVSLLSRQHALQQGQLILVAEDNLTNKKVIQHQLALLGFPADIANDGIEAIERWEEDDYKLILVDLHMPEIDGVEFIRH